MKDLQIKTRALSSLLKDIDRGKFNFDHPLQRKSGIWNKKMMSLLIDSAIRMYPIYPALVEETENGEYAVIDGKQRLTIFKAYIKTDMQVFTDLHVLSKIKLKNSTTYNELSLKPRLCILNNCCCHFELFIF